MNGLRPISEASRAMASLKQRIIYSAAPHRSVADLCELTGASDSYIRHVIIDCALPRRVDDLDIRWTDEMSAELSRLWREGLSLTAIGRRLDVSRNSVASKARRLGLPKRAVPANLQKRNTEARAD
jgi:DNA-binding NarL/FixJ family response regulator